jgi:hypothetical protein
VQAPGLTEGAEVAIVTDPAPQDDGRQATRALSAADRRELLDELRRVARQVETAARLERRAGRSASTALAGVLRERAAEHRRTADRLRAGLRQVHDVG